MQVVALVSGVLGEAKPWLGVDWGAITGIATTVLAAGVLVTLWGVREARNAAQADLEATQSQLRSAARPLLIEVLRNGPITPDMEAVDNPNLDERATLTKVVPVMIYRTRQAPTEPVTFEPRLIDPRAVLVEVVHEELHWDGAFGPESAVHTQAYVSVPLRNVGRGLAIIRDQDIRIPESPGGSLEPSADRTRVPPGETTRVKCVAVLDDQTDTIRSSSVPEMRPVFRLIVPYMDFSESEEMVVVLLVEKWRDDWRIRYLEQQPIGMRVPTPVLSRE